MSISNPGPRPNPWTPPRTVPCPPPADGLLVRPYTPDDADQLFHAIDSSRSTLLPWLPWAAISHRNALESRDEIRKFSVAAANVLDPAHSNLGYVLGVFDSRTGELLGGTGLNRMSPDTCNAETGYWVRADRRRQNVASRALRTILTAGLTPQPQGGYGFRRIHIFAAETNAASCMVPSKLGLRKHMHATLDRWVDGLGWCDTLGWEVIDHEWDFEQRTLRNGPGDSDGRRRLST